MPTFTEGTISRWRVDRARAGGRRMGDRTVGHGSQGTGAMKWEHAKGTGASRARLPHAVLGGRCLSAKGGEGVWKAERPASRREAGRPGS